ncbi:integrase core domain-containing protein [Streptomyces sioyaensis]|uniref:integrase core domain-containing protein n=1 Tax=Streptomyces sioyaensis TaxID=67364 RepID=UPI00378CF6CD
MNTASAHCDSQAAPASQPPPLRILQRHHTPPLATRQAAFTDWLDWYNYHRPHTGISGHAPASRVTNLSGQHT